MEEVKSTIVTSYRLKEDTKEKIKQQLSSLGLTQEEYFNKVVGLMELENVKHNSLFAVNATEVQDLTQRLYNIFINLCDQGNSFLSNKDMELQELKAKYKDMLSDKENILQQQKQELQQVYTENTVLQNENEDHKIELMKVRTDYIKQLEQLESSLTDKTNLIEEYKGKNDMLLGQLKTYENYPKELETVKQLLADSQTKVINAEDRNKENTRRVEELIKEVEQLKKNHASQIEDIKLRNKELLENQKDKLTLEKDKAILSQERAHQEQLTEIQQRHNAEVEGYQAKYKELLEQLEHLKATRRAENKTK